MSFLFPALYFQTPQDTTWLVLSLCGITFTLSNVDPKGPGTKIATLSVCQDAPSNFSSAVKITGVAQDVMTIMTRTTMTPAATAGADAETAPGAYFTEATTSSACPVVPPSPSSSSKTRGPVAPFDGDFCDADEHSLSPLPPPRNITREQGIERTTSLNPRANVSFEDYVSDVSSLSTSSYQSFIPLVTGQGHCGRNTGSLKRGLSVSNETFLDSVLLDPSGSVLEMDPMLYDVLCEL
jgi:hypothetical protein